MPDRQIRELIAKAVSAERLAAAHENGFLQKSWMEIAAGYRELAQLTAEGLSAASGQSNSDHAG